MTLPIIAEPKQPTTMPIRPPQHETDAASIKNCMMISRRLAPMAMRMPISRVRSVTDTSMMFIMPIPPTSREIIATPPISSASCSAAAASCSCH